MARGVNRLCSLQYLQLLKDANLDKDYNIFIPDFRNSGASDEARTKLGYNFAQDILHTMEMLKDKYGLNNFTLIWIFARCNGSGNCIEITCWFIEKKRT